MAQTSIQSLEKIAKTSEDTKKLLGKLTKLNNQISKKDETQTTKLSSLVRKVADSEFTPTFLQKFLQKPNEEGNDLSARLEKTQNDFIGSFKTLFKNREAKEAARLNIEISKLRELQAIPGVTKEEIEGLVAKEESKELTKKLDEVKEANTKSFENLVQMFKLDTSALETFTKEDQALLKENINLHGDVKKVLQNTELKHHETVQALEKIVSASHEKGSLFVHDINTQEQLDKLNNYNEIEIEMARDKMRKDDISALQAKENQKQLLNATKSSGAGGMGAAGGGGGGESGSGIGFAETYLVGKEVVPRILTGIRGLLGIGMITGTGAGATVLTTTGAIAAGTAAIGAGAIAAAVALVGFTFFSMWKTYEFNKNLSDEEKLEKRKALDASFGTISRQSFDSQEEYEENMKAFKETQKKSLNLLTGKERDVKVGSSEYNEIMKKHSLLGMSDLAFAGKSIDNKPVNNLLKSSQRQEDIKDIKDKKDAAQNNIVTTNIQNNNNINESSTSFGVRVVDESRRVFV
jgi:hypothetical protein